MHPLSSSSLWEEFTIANNQITNTPEQSMFQLFQATQPQTSPDYGGGIPKPSGGIPQPSLFETFQATQPQTSPYTPATITREDLRPNPTPAIALGIGVLLLLTLIRN